MKSVYPVGTRLPSEELLSSRFSVGRHTIREAMRRLCDDGLVESRRGAPTTVIRPAQNGEYVHEIGSINDLLLFSSELQLHIASIENITVIGSVVQRIGCHEGESWLHVGGFRHPAGKETPVCWMEVFIHEDYAGVARLLDRNTGPIFELIETLYGERIVKVEQTMRLVPMSIHAAQALGVQEGETSAEITRTFMIGSGKTVEASISYYPANDFIFSMILRRTV